MYSFFLSFFFCTCLLCQSRLAHIAPQNHKLQSTIHAHWTWKSIMCVGTLPYTCLVPTSLKVCMNKYFCNSSARKHGLTHCRNVASSVRSGISLLKDFYVIHSIEWKAALCIGTCWQVWQLSPFSLSPHSLFSLPPHPLSNQRSH